MQPTTVIGLLALIVTGVIVADVIANKGGGTKAAGKQVNTFWTTTVNGLLGK